MALIKWKQTFKLNGAAYKNAAVYIYLSGTTTAARVFDANGKLQDSAPQIYTDSIGYVEFSIDTDDYPSGQLFDIECHPSAICSEQSIIKFPSLMIIQDTEGGRKFKQVFAQNTEPADDDNPKEEDLWIDTDNGNALYRYDGESWVSVRDTSLTNFDSRNDRNGDPITAPTIATDGTALEHSYNADGSVNITFQWSWTGTDSDIDGWMVYLYASTSSSSYTIGTSPQEERIVITYASKRSVTFYGCPSNIYYTFGVQAYRVVDPDIDSSGYIKSSIVQPSLSSEDPYRPSDSAEIRMYQGAKIKTDPDPATNGGMEADSTSIVAYNSSGVKFFEVIYDGTNEGDGYLGDYDNDNAGLIYDHSAGLLKYRGALNVYPINKTTSNTKEVFHFDGSLVGMFGTEPDQYGDGAYTWRPDGVFGEAISVDDSTTNLLSNGDFSNGLNDWTYSSYGIEVVSSDIWPFDYSVHIKDESTTQGAYLYQYKEYASSQEGNYFSASCLARLVSGTVAFRLSFYDSGGSLIEHNTIYLDNSTIEHVTVTAEAPADTYKVRVAVLAFSNLVGEAYVTGIQLEQKAWATSFTPTSRSFPTSTPLTYSNPLDLNSDFTIMTWVKPNFAYDIGTSDQWMVLDFFQSTSDRVALYYLNSNQKWYIAWIVGGSGVYSTITTPNFSAGDTIFLAMRRSGNTLNVLVNGTKGSDVTVSNFTSIPTSLYIGCNGVGGAIANMLIDELCFEQRALSDSAINKIYSNNTAFDYPDEALILESNRIVMGSKYSLDSKRNGIFLGRKDNQWGIHIGNEEYHLKYENGDLEYEGYVVSKTLIPTGAIVPFDASLSIPDGWVEFTDANGRHIIGAGGSHSVGDTGGDGNTYSETLNSSTNGSHDGSPTESRNQESSSNTARYYYSGADTAGDHYHSVSVSYTRKYQQLKLIKATSSRLNFPAGAIVFTATTTVNGGNLSAVYTDKDGCLLRAGSSETSGGGSLSVGSISTDGNHTHSSSATHSSIGGSNFCWCDPTEGDHDHSWSSELTVTEKLKRVYLKAWKGNREFRHKAGHIIMYTGSTAPEGWLLCDGNNGTPDLRDYFLVFSDDSNVGTSVDESNELSFSGTMSTESWNHDHLAYGCDCLSAYAYLCGHDSKDVSHNHTVSQTRSHTPNYYALTFIMKATE